MHDTTSTSRRRTAGAVLAILLAMLCLLPRVGATEPSTLAAFEATFKVKMKGLRGEMRMSLREADEGFAAVSILEPKGIARVFARGRVEEAAQFTLSDGRLVPASYRSRDTVSRDERFAQIDYDWSDDRARGSDEDGAFDHPVDETAFDRVTLQYALMLDLANGAGRQAYSLVDGSRLKKLDVRIVGEKRIDVPYGEFDVVMLQHQAQGSSRVMTLWCAPELGYLPVRIEQHRKGKRIVLAEMTGYGS